MTPKQLREAANGPWERTHRYRCHRLHSGESCMKGTPWERHAYDIVPIDFPDVPGECNDDADGEDPGPQDDGRTT